MTLRRHEHCRDSGEDWLGAIPVEWGVAAIKRHFDVVGGATPKSDVSDYWDGDVLWVTPADLGRLDGWTIDGTLRSITRLGLDACAADLVPAGSVILSTRAPIGSLGIAGSALCTNQGCKALVATGGIEERFLAYVLSGSVAELNNRGKGTTFLELSGDELGAFKVPVPPKLEQLNIIAFLDRETAKIDTLVEEQRRLIELLKEKRQAVISHTVTKGLDPTTPMKDSGVNLGMVPEHWQVTRLKTIKALVPNAFVDGPFGSNLKSEHYVDDGPVYVIESGFATTGLINERNLKSISEEHYLSISRSEVKSGDIVIAKIGAYFGKSAILPQLKRRAVISGNTLKLTTNTTLCEPEWALWQLRNLKQSGQIDLLANGSAQPALSLGAMNNLAFLLPPLEEQKRIVRRLAADLHRLDSLATEAQSATDLLLERRAALIYAAVTGKIDVRGLAPSDSAQAA